MTTMQQTRQLTDDERAAIEAYSGPVKRVPRGASGLPKLVWDEKKNALRYDEPPKYGRNYRLPAHIQDQQRKRVRRQERVKEMALQRRPVKEIAQALETPLSTIYEDIMALRKAGVAV